MNEIKTGNFCGLDVPVMNFDGMTMKEIDLLRLELFNRAQGNLNQNDGIDCDICLNRGYINFYDEDTGYFYEKNCDCMKKRNAVLSAKKSGLNALLEKNFDNFTTAEAWQADVKNKAFGYAQLDNDDWLYFSGQRGCGKTHLCSAVCSELLSRGRDVRYLLWTDISHKLDSLKYKYEEYDEYMNMLKNTDVVFIDDFLKNSLQDNAEIKKAYLVINARYFADKKTVISSENNIFELEKTDSSVSGRIKEKAKNKYIIAVTPQKGRDYRERINA